MSSSVKPRVEFVERRSHERAATALLAFATANDQRFSCCIRNVSDTGAMLEFIGSGIVNLPMKFDIVLTNGSRLAVQLIWRKDRQAGVVFCL